ncbi:MAG: SCO family protein [Ardenticatenaceae bacterium]|nr:SCO family protein [Ardenticatenaceae bacterium]
MTELVDTAKVQDDQLRSKRAKRIWTAVGLIIIIILGGIALIATGTWQIGPPEFHGMVIQAPQPANNFTLYGADDQPISLRDFRGKTVLLYFGYTFCPDVCPATMVELKQMMADLGNDAENVQVIMISVDPERDTPASLQDYVSHFHPSFIGLTGHNEDEVLAVTTPLGVFYEKHEGTAASGYLIDHTATVSVIDKEGYLRLVYPFGVTGSEMAADLRYIIRD